MNGIKEKRNMRVRSLGEGAEEVDSEGRSTSEGRNWKKKTEIRGETEKEVKGDAEGKRVKGRIRGR